MQLARRTLADGQWAVQLGVQTMMSPSQGHLMSLDVTHLQRLEKPTFHQVEHGSSEIINTHAEGSINFLGPKATGPMAPEMRQLPLEEIKGRCPEEVEDARMYVPWKVYIKVERDMVTWGSGKWK